DFWNYTYNVATPINGTETAMTEETTSPAPKDESSGERRRDQRIRCNCEARWRISGSRSTGSGKATLHDISPHGISLVVDSLPTPGTILDVSVERGPDESYFLPQPVRVRHIKALDSHHWLLGCRFVKPLETEVFESLLLNETAH